MEKLSYLSISLSDTHTVLQHFPVLEARKERTAHSREGTRRNQDPHPASRPDSGGILDSLMDFTDQTDFGRNRLQEETPSVQLADSFPVGRDSLGVQLAAVPWTFLSHLLKAKSYISWLYHQPPPAMLSAGTGKAGTFPQPPFRNTLLLWHML